MAQRPPSAPLIEAVLKAARSRKNSFEAWRTLASWLPEQDVRDKFLPVLSELCQPLQEALLPAPGAQPSTSGS